VPCTDIYLERNFDGFPEIICCYNEGESIECEECEISERCEYCGLPIDVVPHDEDCEYWIRILTFDPNWSELSYTLFNVPIEAYDNEV
jgi:hypothetical protein